MIEILLAVPDHVGEPDLVARAPSMGVRILRRCVDAVDLLAAGAADPHVPVVVSAGLPRLEADLVERIGAQRAVIGLASTDADVPRLERLGLVVVRSLPQPDDTWAAVRAVLEGDAESGVWSTGVWTEPAPAADPARVGRLVAVWGPQGAPGRTSLAIGIAEAVAAGGRTCGLIDADTYAPSVSMALGIVEETSGLVVACRHADNSTLTRSALVGLCHRMRSDWYVLGGIGRPDRWPDARPAALDRLWSVAREAFDVTVVDIGFCLEADDGPWAARRNAATLSALAAADQVVCVADASALGAARLVSAWPSLTAAAPLADRLVVQNRAARRDHGWRDALVTSGIPDPVLRVPRDDRALTACWQSARTPGERAPRSGLRRALGLVAAAAVSP